MVEYTVKWKENVYILSDSDINAPKSTANWRKSHIHSSTYAYGSISIFTV